MSPHKRKENGGCLHSIWIGWIRICRTINDYVELYFEYHTRFITNHHRLTIGLSLLFVAIMAVGAVRFNSLERNEELFIPQGSQAFTDLEKGEKYFRFKYRFNEFILTPDGGNVLDSNDAFLKALNIHDEIIKIENYKNTCFIEKGRTGCLYTSALDIFNYNKTWIQSLNGANISMHIANATRDPLLSTLFNNGRAGNLNFNNVLGNFKYDVALHSVSADAVRVIYYLQYATTDDDTYSQLTDWEGKFIDLLEEKVDTLKSEGYTLNYYAQRTRDDAVLQSTVGDLPLFSVAFILMVLFCLAVFFNCKNPITGHLTVGISGIIVIMLGVGCGFGLSMWIGTDFVAFTGILMFLILGIGMDNMFIIIDAVESVDPDIQGPERLVIAMKHIGGSITMTTTTDLVAFAVSTVSDFPAVHLFCVYAALSIFFAYAMLLTLFLGLITADIHRLEEGKRDVCPCCTAKNYDPNVNQWANQDKKITKIILNKWGELLMTTPMKIIVFIAACGLLAAGVYGTTEITQVFEWKKLGRDGSYFVEWADRIEGHFPAGYGVSIIIPPTANYSSASVQQQIIALDEIAKSNSRYENTTINFMTAFHKFAADSNIPDITGDNFCGNLSIFVNIAQTFKEDLNYKADGCSIDSSRVVYFYENNNDAINQANAMKTIRTDLEEKSTIPGIFPISILFIYAEQFAAVLDSTILNLAICAGAVLVITLPYLMHPGITGLVFLSFASLLFELFGLMAAWDTSLDAIAMIVIIMAIGFSVDYTCHIAHAFMISKKNTPEKRVIDALTTMGSSVLNGGISTFLGMLITGFSGAEGFRIFFRMVFGIVVLGLLHGLCFLPVLLSIFIRHDLREDMKDFIDEHDEKDRKRSERRFSKLDDRQKRRQSIAYRRGSSKTQDVDQHNVKPVYDKGTDNEVYEATDDHNGGVVLTSVKEVPESNGNVAYENGNLNHGNEDRNYEDEKKQKSNEGELTITY